MDNGGEFFTYYCNFGLISHIILCTSIDIRDKRLWNSIQDILWVLLGHIVI
jgi:hypothetical protein